MLIIDIIVWVYSVGATEHSGLSVMKRENHAFQTRPFWLKWFTSVTVPTNYTQCMTKQSPFSQLCYCDGLGALGGVCAEKGGESTE